MANATPQQEQRLIDAQVRLSHSAMCLARSGDALNRSDDRILNTRRRRVVQDAERDRQRARSAT